MCLTRKPMQIYSKKSVHSLHSKNNSYAPGSSYIKMFPPLINDDRFVKMPNKPITPENVAFNPTKPISKQTLFERWMVAQIERQTGLQPAICVEHNIMLTNLRRVRPPTTFYTLQQQINDNTHAIKHANNLDSADWSDDEEKDEILINKNLSGGISQTAARNSNHNNANALYHANSLDAGDFTDDEEEEVKMLYHGNNSDAEDEYNLDGLNNNSGNKPQSHHHLHISDSKDDANDYTYNMKKTLDKRRRRKKTRNKSKNKETVIGLWYKVQLELKQGS
eukprot:504198_1